MTRGELREELKEFATRADLEQLATRIDLKIDLWGGALLDRLEQKLAEELARHANAITSRHCA